MRRRSSPRNRLEVRGEPTPPRLVPDPSHVPVPEGFAQPVPWSGVPFAPCTRQDNVRLLVKIREHHAASDGVMGAPRMHEVLGYDVTTQ